LAFSKSDLASSNFLAIGATSDRISSIPAQRFLQERTSKAGLFECQHQADDIAAIYGVVIENASAVIAMAGALDGSENVTATIALIVGCREIRRELRIRV
jgi:hypothetical protein